MEHPTKEEVIEYFKNAKKIHFNNYIYKDLPPCEFDISTLRYAEIDEEAGFYCEEALGIDTNSDILMYDHVTRKYADILEYKEDVNFDTPTSSGNTERPTRYSSREVNGMDVIDLIEYWGLNFCEGNILRYLLRIKGQDISDMKKIIVYANRYIEILKKNNYTDKHEW